MYKIEKYETKQKFVKLKIIICKGGCEIVRRSSHTQTHVK